MSASARWAGGGGVDAVWAASVLAWGLGGSTFAAGTETPSSAARRPQSDGAGLAGSAALARAGGVDALGGAAGGGVVDAAGRGLFRAAVVSAPICSARVDQWSALPRSLMCSSFVLVPAVCRRVTPC